MSQCTASQLTAATAYCYGSLTKTRHPLFQQLLYTEGVEQLCETARAYWLLDIFGSYIPTLKRDEMLADISFWTLRVADESADIICERDEGDEAIRQHIEYTDFPEGDWKFYIQFDGEHYTVMLPSEY